MRASSLTPLLLLLAFGIAAAVGVLLLGGEAPDATMLRARVTGAPPGLAAPAVVELVGAGIRTRGRTPSPVRRDDTPPSPRALLVRAEDGEPLAGARVVFRPHVRGCRFPELEPDPWAVEVGEDGAVPLPRTGSWEMTVRAPGRVGARVRFAGDDPPGRIALRPGLLVAGRVYGDGGVPPERTWIRASVLPYLADAETIASAATDATGRFVLGPVPERCTLVVVTRGPDGQELRSLPVAVAPGLCGPVRLDWPLPADPR